MIFEAASASARDDAQNIQWVLETIATPPAGSDPGQPDANRLIALCFAAKTLSQAVASDLHLAALRAGLDEARKRLSALFVPEPVAMSDGALLAAHWDRVRGMGVQVSQALDLPPPPGGDVRRAGPLGRFLAEWCAEASRLASNARTAAGGQAAPLCDQLATRMWFMPATSAQEIRENFALRAASDLEGRLLRVSLPPPTGPRALVHEAHGPTLDEGSTLTA